MEDQESFGQHGRVLPGPPRVWTVEEWSLKVPGYQETGHRDYFLPSGLWVSEVVVVTIRPVGGSEGRRRKVEESSNVGPEWGRRKVGLGGRRKTSGTEGFGPGST